MIARYGLDATGEADLSINVLISTHEVTNDILTFLIDLTACLNYIFMQ